MPYRCITHVERCAENNNLCEGNQESAPKRVGRRLHPVHDRTLDDTAKTSRVLLKSCVFFVFVAHQVVFESVVVNGLKGIRGTPSALTLLQYSSVLTIVYSAD